MLSHFCSPIARYAIRFQLRFLFSGVKQTDDSQYSQIRQKLIKFPYTRMYQRLHNKKIQTNPNDYLSQNIIQDSVAYGCLNEFKSQFLRNNHRFLFQQQEQQKQKNQLSGQQIFYKYFNSKLSKIMQKLNNSKNQQQVSYNLKILFYLKNNPKSKLDLSLFNLKRIQQKGKLQQKAYLINIYQNQPNYLKFLQKFYNQFKNSTKQQQLKAAFIILSIPQFHKKLPSPLCEQCITIISQDIQNLDDWQIYRILQFIFETKYKATRVFTDKIMNQVFKQISQESSHFKIPVVLKLLKLRDALNMDNQKFSNYIKDNPLKFSSIFFKKKVNKEAFLDTISSKDSKRLLPQQIRSQFDKYIFRVFQDIINAGQCDLEQIVQNVKLTLKFYYNFPPVKLTKLQQKLQKQLIPMFDQNQEITFWLLVLLIRINKSLLKKPQIMSRLEKVQKFYHQNYLKSTEWFDKHVNLEKVIQILYHKVRSDISIKNQQKKLQQYDFKFVKTFQQIIYACYVLINTNLSPEKKFKIFQKIIPNLESNLEIGRFRSVKNLFTIISALRASKCEASKNSKTIGFLYKKIEIAYMRLMAKQRNSPVRTDLAYIKKVFTEDRSNLSQKSDESGKKHLHNYDFILFLQECMRNPQKFKNAHQQYAQKTNLKLRINPKSKGEQN